jgi:large subunit ribosomal protein L17
MRKRIKGAKLQREKDQRIALMRTLLVSLIKHKRIETTLAKAKELRPFAERKITIAKRGLNGSEIEKVAKIRLLKKDLPNRETVMELFKLAEFFKNREGGYIRILKLMPRKSDSTNMALVEWVNWQELEGKEKSGKKSVAKPEKAKEDKKADKNSENKSEDKKEVAAEKKK